MFRGRRILLRDRKYVQGKSATKGKKKDIDFGQTLKQSGHNANVRKQEKEAAVSVVLVIVG